MEELCLDIWDIACNCIAYNANNIWLKVTADTSKDILSILVQDDGYGIDKQTLKCISNPDALATKLVIRFNGIRQNAINCGGSFKISSKINKITKISLEYKISNANYPKLGRLGYCIARLIQISKAKVGIYFWYEVDSRIYKFDLQSIGITISEQDTQSLEIINWLSEVIQDNINTINNQNII